MRTTLIFSFNYLNTKHQNIKFTFVKEQDNELATFPRHTYHEGHDLKHMYNIYFPQENVHRTANDFFLFSSYNYKTGLIKTLLDRIHKVNNIHNGYESDINELNRFKVSFIW